MIYDGYHFIYGNLESRQYGLIIGHVDTNPYLDMIGTTQSSTIFNKKGLRKYFVCDTYEDSPVSYTVEIVTDGKYVMTLQDRRKFEQSFFYQNGYKKLYVDIVDDVMGETYDLVDGEPKALYLNCRFTNPKKIEDGNGRVVGYSCTMECDSPMFTQDSIENTYDFSSSVGQTQYITIDVDSNINEYIYPKVTINTGESMSNISIVNSTDDNTRFTTFSNVTGNKTIVMDSEINYINNSDINYPLFTNQHFIRLLPGQNVLIITGAVKKITVEYSNRRFM